MNKKEYIKKLFKEAIANNIGSFQKSTQLNEIARVGYINGELEVYVWTDDPGNIPHVHIRDTNSKGMNFETCVKLDTNEYFLHGKHKDKFNAKQKKEFAEFMEAKPLKGPYKTNYELAVSMWELNNSNTEVNIKKDVLGNIIIPDYRKIYTDITLF